MDKIDKMLQLGAEIHARMDGWENVITGLGTAMRDKAVATFFERGKDVSDEELENMFHEDFIGRTVITALVDDALGDAFTIKRSVDTVDAETGTNVAEATTDEVKQLTAALKRWKVLDRFKRSLYWGRLYGRGALYPVVSGDPTQPIDLDDEKIKLSDLIVLEKRDFSCASMDNISLEPVHWILSAEEEELGLHIHTSRLIHFGGLVTSRRERVRRAWSDHSIVRPSYNMIRDTQSNWRSVVHRMQDASQGVFKIKGLFEMLTGSNDAVAALKKRTTLMDYARSVVRAIMVDSEEEDFTYQEATFTGTAEVLLTNFQLLAAAVEMPLTRLLGLPPNSLGSEDVAGQRNWNKRVTNYQELEVRDPLELIVNLVAQTEGLGRGWEVVFPKPWSFTPNEQASLQSQVASTDVSYINAGVFLAEEVALVRGQEDGYLLPIEIDLELRKKLLELSLDTKVTMKENPPDFTPKDPQDPNNPEDPNNLEDPDQADEPDPEDPKETDEDEPDANA